MSMSLLLPPVFVLFTNTQHALRLKMSPFVHRSDQQLAAKQHHSL